MCWGLAASAAMVAAGAAGTALTLRRGEPWAIPATLAYFAVMEALQVGGYATLGACGTPANRAVTAASYLHIVFQPLLINAFAMAIAPQPVTAPMRRAVYALAALASAALLLRLVPIPALGPCVAGTSMCADAFCTRAGAWHIAWEVPLNGGLQALAGSWVEFPAYFLAVFALPLAYGAWRFVVLHALLGPILAWTLTSDPDEMPAIWCLVSVGILGIALSPTVRHRVMGARSAWGR